MTNKTRVKKTIKSHVRDLIIKKKKKKKSHVRDYETYEMRFLLSSLDFFI